MHPYRSFIHRYQTVSDVTWREIEKRLVRKEIKAGDLLLPEGRICRHVWFLERGLMRYFINRDSREITKFFTVAPYCFTSQRSFNQRLPATENIEALQDGILWEMTMDSANCLMTLPGWSLFVRKLTQEVQFLTEGILEDLQEMTPAERYQKMLLNGDPLLQQVSLKHLASFLGIAPQSLSRIRKRMIANTSEVNLG
ncbi:MAG: Crp/Fnr family transcriptional regulator [Bacteroidota bacterium]